MLRSTAKGGSALVVGLVTLAVLAMIAAATFQTVTNRFRSNYQTASWHDSLTSAESGVNYTLARLRNPLTMTDLTNVQNGASPLPVGNVLTNPFKIPGSIQYDLAKLNPGDTSRNGTVISGTYNGATYTRIQLPAITIPHQGEGSSQMTSVATIDVVPGTNVENGGANSWYRIQSVGTVPLSGSANVGIQKYDNFLRKLQFRVDSNGIALAKPQAVRRVEALAKPVTIGSAALFGQTGINLNNQNIVINSYDSRSALTSTNGLYDPAKSTKAANVVTDDNLQSNNSPGVINLSPTGAYVYGNIATNNTPVSGSTGHVSGTVTQDFYQSLPNPPDPNSVSSSWPLYDSNVSGNSNLTMQAGTQDVPARYSISNSGGGGSNGVNDLSVNNTLNITTPSNDTSGTYYVEIWVKGDLKVSGNGLINIPKNVHATFYVDGTVNIAGNGVLNNSLVPGNVMFYGNHNPSVTQSISIAGNGVFAGILYAPSASVQAQGSGNNGDIYGAIIANTIFFNGTTSLHYDQALGDIGAVIDYRIASWYEDTTLTR